MNEEQLEAIKETITFLSDLENRGDYGAKNLKYKLASIFKDNLKIVELSHEEKMLFKELNGEYGLGIG